MIVFPISQFLNICGELHRRYSRTYNAIISLYSVDSSEFQKSLPSLIYSLGTIIENTRAAPPKIIEGTDCIQIPPIKSVKPQNPIMIVRNVSKK